MKNFHLYIILFLVIVFKGSLVNFINNFNKALFIKEESLEIKALNTQINYLNEEYNKLLDFKNNINIKTNYTITNSFKTNYGFDKLLINGTNYQVGNEVVNNAGLIGIISKINSNYSEITYIYDTNILVKINNIEGKIISKDKNNNLIIKELSNYSKININDPVYSINNTYIGKVISIQKEEIDTKVIVETINVNDNNYVIVIGKNI